MDPVATGADTKETRILAAIVFTDVVGFSRLAAQNEARVYVALQRDMGVMTNLCRAHGGQVLNTMGDGMLLCFMSAVDAMTCALEIQRTLYNQARSLPANDILHHRIGVHLGDVIMSGDNVFGDGVNVAARLQAVAKPDAICYSQTVHEVIKNKLKLDDAKYVGNQQLKNLGEPVRIWQVPPIQESRQPVMLDDLPKPVEEGGASGLKGFVFVIASIVLVGGLVAAFMTMKVPQAKANPRPKATKTDKPEPSVTNPPEPSTPSLNPAQVATEIERLKQEMNFAGIVDLLQRAGKNAPEEEAAKAATYGDLAKMMEYLNGQVASANVSAPLRYEDTTAEGPRTIELHGTGPRMQAKINDWYGQVSWAELGPASVLAAAQSVSEKQFGGMAPAPPEVKGWIELFAKEYGL